MELEDIRGREFRWKYISGSPLKIDITENRAKVGQVSRPRKRPSNFFVSFAGIDWVIRSKMPLLPRRYTIAFQGSGMLLGEVRYSRWGFGEGTCTLDGVRTYRLNQLSFGTSVWTLDGQEMVEFNRYTSFVSESDDGRISISNSAELVDAPVLSALGLAMGGSLFKQIVGQSLGRLSSND